VSEETVERREHYVRMNGREVFKFATRVLVSSGQRLLDECGVAVEDVDVYVPHQANVRIIHHAANRLGILPERVVINVDRYGNTGAASVYVALEEALATGRIKKGDLIRFREWYIWSGQPNEGLRLRAADIAKGIKEREKLWGIWGRVKAGPADASIFDDFEPGKSVAGYMAKEGIRWEAADKRPGSRKQGWQSIRQMLEGAIPGPEGVREQAGLFVCRCCQQFLRTVPVLPRDDKDPDDVNTNSEDHVGDELRYRVRARNRRAGMVDW